MDTVIKENYEISVWRDRFEKIDKKIEKVGIKTANSLNKAANTVDKAKNWLNNLLKKK